MPRIVRRPRMIWPAMALALAACASPQAGAPTPERLRDASPPALIPTELFEAPRARAAAAGAELSAGAEDLAARAQALRVRSAALSGDETLDPETRARLEAARPR